MKIKIEYKRFFAYSQEKNKCFFTEFDSGVNIVYGKNTSGKSTLLQAINYTFGINDEKHKLSEILSEKVIFRIDFYRVTDKIEKISIIRDSDFLYVKRQGKAIEKFSGVSQDNSTEHVYLKRFIADLLGVNLFLESSGEYKLASIEAMFLPYYVAQDYGWVIPLKSFRGLDFFKNFKNDYYDYYLGIVNEYDREEKQRLELLKKEYETEIRFLSSTEQKNDVLKLSILKDESFVSKSTEYIESFKSEKIGLIENEKKYLLLCNDLRFLEERKNVLNRVNRAIKDSKDNKCPTCHQSLLITISKIYEDAQNIDDTKDELEKINQEIKTKTGSLHTVEKAIQEHRARIAKNYSVLENYSVDNLTVGSWIDNKANVRLVDNIEKQIGVIQIKLNDTNKLLNGFRTEKDIQLERGKKDASFKDHFNRSLKDLGVHDFGEEYSLYKMKLFPQQGVELLKTLLAYNISFNKIIRNTSYIHRLPLVMDAVFKEDVDESNRGVILKFINDNKPNDTQTIISLAQSMDNAIGAEDYNQKFFGNKAKLILINKEKERSFLNDYDPKYDKNRDDLFKIIED